MAKPPFMSLANLVEYASAASPARRRAIVEQYHQPQIVKFDWHGASDVIFMKRACNFEDADQLIDFEKERIRGQLSGHTEKDRRLKHIIHLVELLESSDFAKLTVGAVPSPATDLSSDCVIGGLTVRVRPELVLSRPRFGDKSMGRGVVKCHNLCSLKLDAALGALFAVGLQIFSENVIGEANTDGELCRVYDLFADEFYSAPKNQKRIRAQLLEASQEIQDRWDAVAARAAEKAVKHRKAS